MFLVASRIAWRRGRGGCKGNELATLRFPRLQVCRREGAASEKNPLQPIFSDSPADLRATYPPPLLVGGVLGGQGGRSVWWSKGDIRFARGGSRQPSERELGVGGVAAERHCSCRLPTLRCVRERSRAFQVRDGRPRGEGGGWRALCGQRAPRAQVGAGVCW